MVFESQRLQYRVITKDDFFHMCTILQDIDVMYAWEYAFSEEQVWQWIEKNTARYEKDGYGYYGAILKDTGEFVGVVGPMTEPMEGKLCTEIAYLFAKKHWGKGYAAEGAAAARDYAFEKLGINTLVAQIKPDNLSSRKVAEKIGMKVTGEFVKHYMGRDIPHLIYTIEKASLL